jgi:hypothetical protein
MTTACVSIAHPTRGHVGQLIGIIQEPTCSQLRVMTGDRDIQEIRLDPATQYTKWLTHQPWTVDQLMRARDLTIGRCIKVTLQQRDVHAAKRVEVSLDRPGSLNDPCRHIR